MNRNVERVRKREEERRQRGGGRKKERESERQDFILKANIGTSDKT